MRKSRLNPRVWQRFLAQWLFFLRFRASWRSFRRLHTRPPPLTGSGGRNPLLSERNLCSMRISSEGRSSRWEKPKAEIIKSERSFQRDQLCWRSTVRNDEWTYQKVVCVDVLTHHVCVQHWCCSTHTLPLGCGGRTKSLQVLPDTLTTLTTMGRSILMASLKVAVRASP